MEERKDPSIGVYIRVSTGEQNPELQSQEIKNYCKARGWERISVYSDVMTSTNEKRKGLLALLQDAQLRKIDIIIAWKLDRMFRSVRHAVTVMEHLEKHGVSLILLRDNIDNSTASGRLHSNVLASFAQFEREVLSERIRAGLAVAKKRPDYPGPGLGKLRPDDKILELALQGKKSREIAAILLAECGGDPRVPGKAKRGGHKYIQHRGISMRSVQFALTKFRKLGKLPPYRTNNPEEKERERPAFTRDIMKLL